MDGEGFQPSEQADSGRLDTLRQLIMVWESSALNAASSLAGLGAQLFQPGHIDEGIEYGPDGQPLRNPDGTVRHRTNSTPVQNTEAAQKVYNAITAAARDAGMQPDPLLQIASVESHYAPTSISEGSPQTYIDTINYLSDPKNDRGHQILEKNPKFAQLKQALEEARKKYPDAASYTAALRNGQLNSLVDLINTPEVGAMIMAAHLRMELEKRYGFTADVEAQINAKYPHATDEEKVRIRAEITQTIHEGTRVINGESYLAYRFGETVTRKILDNDVTESVTPFFTKEDIAAHPDLAEFKDKSAHELVTWARDQANVNLAPFYQSIGVNAKNDYPLDTKPEQRTDIDKAFGDVVNEWVDKHHPEWKKAPDWDQKFNRYVNNFRAYTYMIGDSEGATWDSKSGDHLHGTRKTFDLSGDHPVMGSISSATGLLQVVQDTWRGLQTNHPELTNFLPPNQIRATAYLIQGRHEFDDVLLGRFDNAVIGTGGEWASFPGSHYGQTLWTMEQVRNFYLGHGGLLEGQEPPTEPAIASTSPGQVFNPVTAFGTNAPLVFSGLPGGLSTAVFHPPQPIQDVTPNPKFAGDKGYQALMGAIAQGGPNVDALKVVANYYGLHEVTNKREVTALLNETRAWPNYDPHAVPWCAGFVGFVENRLGRPGKNTLWARNYATYGEEIRNPQPGDIVVMSGHVAYYVGSAGNGRIWIAGGNQSDAINVTTHALSDVVAFRHPPQSLAPDIRMATAPPTPTTGVPQAQEINYRMPGQVTPGAPPSKVYVVGDSMALGMGQQLKAALKVQGVNTEVVNMAIASSGWAVNNWRQPGNYMDIHGPVEAVDWVGKMHQLVQDAPPGSQIVMLGGRNDVAYGANDPQYWQRTAQIVNDMAMAARDKGLKITWVGTLHEPGSSQAQDSKFVQLNKIYQTAIQQANATISPNNPIQFVTLNGDSYVRRGDGVHIGMEQLQNGQVIDGNIRLATDVVSFMKKQYIVPAVAPAPAPSVPPASTMAPIPISYTVPAAAPPAAAPIPPPTKNTAPPPVVNPTQAPAPAPALPPVRGAAVTPTVPPVQTAAAGAPAPIAPNRPTRPTIDYWAAVEEAAAVALKKTIETMKANAENPGNHEAPSTHTVMAALTNKEKKDPDKDKKPANSDHPDKRRHDPALKTASSKDDHKKPGEVKTAAAKPGASGATRSFT